MDMDERIASMRISPANASLRFHAITLTATDDGQVHTTSNSMWVGFKDDDWRVEIRQSRVVTAAYGKIWDELDLPYLFAWTPDDLLTFLLLGGNALVEQSLAEEFFGDLLAPRACYPAGSRGYVGASALKSTAFRRAPTPKLRMEVLKRDHRRCRICGRNPDNHVDLELHVHHIRPWQKGGLTDISNLITLCHTCHNGLHPHDDHSLFQYIEKRGLAAHQIAYARNVSNYRQVGFLALDEGRGLPEWRRPTP